MEDYNAWEAVHQLLLKVEWLPRDKKHPDGHGRIDIITHEVCPVCGNKRDEDHKNKCALNNAISEISRVLYSGDNL